MEISVLRLGQIGTNCYIFRKEGSAKCGVVVQATRGSRWPGG